MAGVFCCSDTRIRRALRPRWSYLSFLGQRWTVKIQRLEDYPRAAGRTLDTSWALKFNGLKFDADLDAAAVCSIHEKADSSQAS